MDDSDRLSALKETLRARLGAARYELWIGTHTRLAWLGGALEVGGASTAEMRFLRRRIDGALVESLRELGIACEIRYVADRAEQGRQAELPFMRVEPTPAAASPAQAKPHQLAARLPLASSALEDFHLSPVNALAVQAAREVAEQAGRYSPLLICGPVGCGKSHLLAALARRARAARPRLRVLSLSAELFTTQFLDALHRRDLPGFRHKVRSVELLIVDDIQFIAAKKATVAELAYTIDAIQAHGGQVALAADRSLAELQSQSPELASRLASGLAAQMESPDFALRRAIVRSLAARASIELPPEVADFIAQQVVGSGRLLSGALNRLAAASAVADEPLTREFAAAELDSFCRQHAPQVRLADIQRAVCDTFGVESSALKSARKDRGVAEPRMLAMWLARRYTRAALSEIGDFFGRRSHSTVVSAQKKLDSLISASGELRVGDGSCHVEDAVRRVEARLRRG